MDLLQNLEVFIPADAEVKLVPLRILPSSVQRRMGSLPSSSWQPADSLEGVWICPAHLRGRGQKPAERTGEQEEDAKRLVWQQSHAMTGPIRMSFVTANRAAYNVLSSGTLPRKAVSAAAAAACTTKTHRDAIVVYRNRIYLIIRRRPGRHQGRPPRGHPSSDRPATGHKRQASAQSLLPRPKQPKKKLLTEINDDSSAHQEAPGGSGLSAPGPCLGPGHATLPQEAEGPRSKGDAEVPELGMAAEEGHDKGNPSSGDRPGTTLCRGGHSLGGVESSSEDTSSSSVSAHKQQVDFKALVVEEKIARMKAQLQQRQAALKNLQLP